MRKLDIQAALSCTLLVIDREPPQLSLLSPKDKLLQVIARVAAVKQFIHGIGLVLVEPVDGGPFRLVLGQRPGL